LISRPSWFTTTFRVPFVTLICTLLAWNCPFAAFGSIPGTGLISIRFTSACARETISGSSFLSIAAFSAGSAGFPIALSSIEAASRLAYWSSPSCWISFYTSSGAACPASSAARTATGHDKSSATSSRTFQRITTSGTGCGQGLYPFSTTRGDAERLRAAPK
jgi:hypothetical protein